jgi:peptide/nickel transport system substrate-binding protein
MKHTGWLWLVTSSALIAVLIATGSAETRPQYGGTVRVNMRESLNSLDPAGVSQAGSFAARSIFSLTYDTLLVLDGNGRPVPSLATEWQSDSHQQHWQFQLRRGIRFHDGSPLTPDAVASSLRTANPAWTITIEGDSVVVSSSDPQLPEEMALPRNAIVKRSTDNNVIGTGPFYAADWQPGKHLTLMAEEEYWHGRPYLDQIEIELGRSYRDQMTAFDLGRADLIAIAPEQLHRASLEGRSLASSAPVELFALLFNRPANTPDQTSLREALAISIERASIHSVLLQGTGQPAGSLLPNWMTGYAFTFSIDADLKKARSIREQLRNAPTLTLGYDSNDPLSRLIAERVALNAKDAGLSVQPNSSSTPEIRLVRIPLPSADPWLALAELEHIAGAQMAGHSGSAEDLYAAEQRLLSTRQIIPLFHLPVSYMATPLMKGWSAQSDGTLSLTDAWLGSRQP